jgi:hypothetical protein
MVPTRGFLFGIVGTNFLKVKAVPQSSYRECINHLASECEQESVGLPSYYPFFPLLSVMDSAAVLCNKYEIAVV